MHISIYLSNTCIKNAHLQILNNVEEASSAEGVLARKDPGRGIQLFQANGALKDITQQPLLHPRS